ncbi:MAG: hypothetical protein A3F12_01090 [Gammaproteobacteria bacterium RIFCSPHIGHO2_12_FULL_38_14]|nr:MAG: hypothetical protein A3F12_01090 [Gammaproteobacteria bacterium RIFCSPHIGHO2_12_FULL_38_14]
MKKNAAIFLKDNIFFVSGDIDFYNVMDIYNQSLLLFKTMKQVIFDFSQVKSSDSSGLALAIEWIKLSKIDHQTIQFKHFPEKLLSIAKVSSLYDVICPL